MSHRVTKSSTPHPKTSSALARAAYIDLCGVPADMACSRCLRLSKPCVKVAGSNRCSTCTRMKKPCDGVSAVSSRALFLLSPFMVSSDVLVLRNIEAQKELQRAEDAAEREVEAAMAKLSRIRL